MSQANTGEKLMTFDDVTLGYGRRVVLSGLSFELRSGDYLGIVGPNGSGKTTLLHAILGQLRPQLGSVTMHRRLNYGYVPQAQTMDDHFPLTAFDIVLMGRYRQLGLLRSPSKADREAAMNALDQVGVPDLAHRLFREFSGGQKQRTLMARALVGSPDALVLDEPTNDMDVAAEHATMELIDRLHEQHGILVLMVSHMLNVVANHVEHVAIVGDGRMEMGPVDKIVTSEFLTRLYGSTLEVAEVGGRRVVI